MALPDDFDAYEHLLEQILIAHNTQVERSFAGVEAENISTTMGSLRTAVFMTQDDTFEMLLLRMFLYHFKLREDLPADIYGEPVPERDAYLRYRPQITLVFREHGSSFLSENKLRKAKMELSWRLMKYTSATINHAIAMELAGTIRDEVGLGAGYVIEKGPMRVNYKDTANGITLSMLVISKAEGQKIAELVCTLAGHAFDISKLTAEDREKTYPAVPPLHEIYGKEVRQQRSRPTTQVYFERAELRVNKLGNAITLVDKTGLRKALIHA